MEHNKDRRFCKGDRVTVSDAIVGQGSMASYLPYHGQEVTIAGYWRNGYYAVRDHRGVGCVIDADHLTLAHTAACGFTSSMYDETPTRCNCLGALLS